MSVGKAKKSVAATEYLRWLAFFEREIKRVDKTDFYLAQIAFELFCFRFYFTRWTGDKTLKEKKFKDFILEFESEKPTVSEARPHAPPPEKPKPGHLPPELQRRVNSSKKMWLGIFASMTKTPPGEKKGKGKRPPGLPPRKPNT